jgi:hypothetical protein
LCVTKMIVVPRGVFIVKKISWICSLVAESRFPVG